MRFRFSKIFTHFYSISFLSIQILKELSNPFHSAYHLLPFFITFSILNSEKSHDHIICSSDYKLVCVDEQCNKLYKTYFGENAIDKFFYNMIKESKYCSKVTEIEFSKPLFMTKKGYEDLKNSTKCWICKNTYEEEELEGKDHDHITRKYRESVYQECNVNLSLKSYY